MRCSSESANMDRNRRASLTVLAEIARNTFMLLRS
jgi:hypothetical protein